MLSWWVERGAFDSIEISFLPVGHTHNEPDQVASRCSICCRTRDIATRTRMYHINKCNCGVGAIIFFFLCLLLDWQKSLKDVIGQVHPRKLYHKYSRVLLIPKLSWILMEIQDGLGPMPRVTFVMALVVLEMANLTYIGSSTRYMSTIPCFCTRMNS